MAFIPNLRRRKRIIAAGETAPTPQPSFGYIDTLFDYRALLAASPDSLGKLHASGNPPDMFATVHAGWSAFISDGFTPSSGPALLAPVAITELLRNGQLGVGRSAWQADIDMSGNQSFYSALQTLFSGASTSEEHEASGRR